MNYIIYPDVLFLVNFLMDYMVLRGMNAFLNASAKTFRCIAGAALGATYSCLMLIMPSGYYYVKVLFTYVVIAILMILVAFGKCGWQEGVKRFVLLYCMSFLCSGILNGLYILWGVKNIVRMIITFGVLKACIEVISYFRNRQSMYFDVIIELENHKIKVRAFVDTGNSLKEPISGKPVNILEKKYADMLTENVDISTRYRYIPFHSIGEEQGALEGILADYLYIGKKKITGPVIAIYDGKLSSAGEYHLLINIDEERL